MAAKNDSATVTRETLATMRTDVTAQRENYALVFSRRLPPFAVLGLLLLFGVWLLNQQYRQLLAVSALIVILLICSAMPLLARRAGRIPLGTLIMLMGMSLSLFCLPLIVPDVLPPVAVLLLTLAVGGMVLLESRVGLVFDILIVLFFGIDLLLTRTWSSWAAGLFPVVLPESGLLLIVVISGLLVMSQGIAIIQLIIKGQQTILANQHRLFRTLIDNIPDYIFFKDHESRIVINNVAHAEVLFGAGSPEDAVGKSDFDFFPRDLAEQYFADEQALMESGEPIIDLEEPGIKPDGSPTWHLTTKIPLKDSLGRVAGLVGIARDITERKSVQLERDTLLEVERRQREQLEMIITRVEEVTNQLNQAAAEILASTTQQSAGATEQEAAVTQTAATVEEVRTTGQEMADRADFVSTAAQESVVVTLRGQEAVASAISGMKVIGERVDDIADTILMLSERTQQIGEIIDTVNDIADQSKLLALNASIEAARAGEEGRGFAVVAMEVRQLAEQSRQATDRVRDILQEIQQATNTAVMVTEEGSKGASSGMTLAAEAGSAIHDLAAVIEKSAQAAIEIATSTRQQANGMDQLLGAVTSIRQATMQVAASTRQAERSARNLSDMARQLEETITHYREHTSGEEG